MTQNKYRFNWMRGVSAALCMGAALPSTALAQDNEFLPSGTRNWDNPSYWSLGHCPLPGEDVFIEVSTTSVKAVEYDWTGATGFNSLTLDGDGGLRGIINQSDHTLTTIDLNMSGFGETWYNLSGTGYLEVTDQLSIGFQSGPTVTANFVLNTDADPSAGLTVGDFMYVGYYGIGNFDHQAGFVEASRLELGQGDPGTYTIGGTTAGSTLTVLNSFHIGNGDLGTFEQNGGAVAQTAGVLIMGINTGGHGIYNMRGGESSLQHLYIANNADAEFNHTGGTVTVNGSIYLGLDGTHPNPALYTIEDTDGTPELDITYDLKIGQFSLAAFEMLEGGTVTVGDDLEIWKGTTTSDFSRLYMDFDAGTITAGDIINHSGHILQYGGTIAADTVTNFSTLNTTIRGTGDLQANTITNSVGSFYLHDSAYIRGADLGGGTYQLCNFTNDAHFQMGGTPIPGGTFFGTLTNNSLFVYHAGDFTDSTLINYNNFEMNADFSCMQFVSDANFTVESDRWVTASGANAPNSVENNDTFTMQGRSHVEVGAGKPFVNNGNMYAGAPSPDYATIHGDLENHGYLLPSDSSLPAGYLAVSGNFTQTSGAELRIRIHGAGATEHDRLDVQGTAHLAGELDVRLTDGYVPSLGDNFLLIGWGARTGQFSPMYLPALPAGLEWEVQVRAFSLALEVVESPWAPCPEDLALPVGVEQQDLNAVLNRWGDGDCLPGGAAFPCPEDLSAPDGVEQQDLNAVLNRWGDPNCLPPGDGRGLKGGPTKIR